eukprot:TRINITY_DN1116_c0_g1_i1.p1 TRINITY_DN1116_c0_g1~~TRINITY_DN1116_c0_g1_i1.p1  ORF type:complete len:363 (-),score=57.23 TRINITY_DN1116_c0_g1_i1:259-1347(-)
MANRGDEEEQVQDGDNENLANLISSASAKLDETLPNLSEERYTTREEALETIIECIKNTYIQETLLAKKSDLLRAIKNGFATSQSNKEKLSTATLVSVLAITCSSSWGSLYKDVESILSRTMDDCEDPTIKAACVEALGMCCFLMAEEDRDTINLLNKISLVFESSIDKVDELAPFLASSLDVYCLLTTTLSSDYIVDTLFPNDIQNIVSFIHSSDVDLRLSFGETIAYLSSIAAEVCEKEGEDYSPYYWSSYFDVEEVLHFLETQGLNSKKIGKKERQKQRQGLNSVLIAFQGDFEISTNITLQGSPFTFSSWTEIKQLNFFRDILGGGFQHHMMVCIHLRIHRLESVVSTSEHRCFGRKH